MKKEYLFVGGPYSGQKLPIEEALEQVQLFIPVAVFKPANLFSPPQIAPETYHKRTVIAGEDWIDLFVHGTQHPIHALMDACQKKMDKKTWYRQLYALRSMVVPAQTSTKEVDWSSYYEQGYSPLEAQMEVLGIDHK